MTNDAFLKLLLGGAIFGIVVVIAGSILAGSALVTLIKAFLP